MNSLPTLVISQELPCIMGCGQTTKKALLDALPEIEPAWALFPLCDRHMNAARLRCGEMIHTAVWAVVSQMVLEAGGEANLTQVGNTTEEGRIEYWKIKHTLDDYGGKK